jgi:hypothetical protein
MRASSELTVEATNLSPLPCPSSFETWIYLAVRMLVQFECKVGGWLGIVGIVSIGKIVTIRKDCRDRLWPVRVSRRAFSLFHQ